GELARRVAGIWREVLHVERLDPNDDFFERGGSSLLAVKVAARILRELGIEIALREIFRHPTLARFTGVVASRRMQLIETALLDSAGGDRQLLERVLKMSATEVTDLNQSFKKG